MNTMPHSPEHKITTAQRRRRVVELRRKGHTYREIANRIEAEHGPEALPKSWGRSYVGQDLRRALQRVQSDLDEEAADLVRLELDRLNALQSSLWAKAMAGKLGAVDRILSIMRRRAKYLGLDSPEEIRAKVERGDGTEDWLPALMDALRAFPAARVAAAEAIAPLNENGTR